MATKAPAPAPADEQIAASPDESAAEAAFDAESNIQEDVPKMADLTGIKYVGMADIKILETEDLSNLGFGEDHEALVWSAENGFHIGADRLTAAMRDYFAAQEDFVVV